MMVPTRRFGKTGVDVSMLALGGVLGMSDQLVFRQALKMGVTYWDTADSYGWGKNEKAIGKYFAKFPEDREKGVSGDEGIYFRSAQINREIICLACENEYLVCRYFFHSLCE